MSHEVTTYFLDWLTVFSYLGITIFVIWRILMSQKK